LAHHWRLNLWHLAWPSGSAARSALHTSTPARRAQCPGRRPAPRSAGARVQTPPTRRAFLAFVATDRRWRTIVVEGEAR